MPVVIALVAALVGGAVAAAIVLAVDNGHPASTTVAAAETTTTTAAPATTAVATSPRDLGGAAAVAEKVLPSIVTVEVTVDNGLFTGEASGSGVVYSADGLILTNDHVVADETSVDVVFPDGHIYDAEVVGTDALTDLALLRIDATGLTSITLGSSQALAIGDPTVAIGSPLGLEGGPSVTVGVLSAFGRTVETSSSVLYGMLQTDAPITRGSSGGALVDIEGRLIGITSAIGVSDVGAEGLGFAIPVELVQRVVPDLEANGTVDHAFLGITGSTYLEEQADGSLAPGGVNVESIIPSTGAAAAGLAEGDIIVSFDGTPVTTMDRMVTSLRFFSVGDTIDLGINRDGETLTLQVTLRQRPEGV